MILAIQEFELGILKIRPEADIYMFELNSKKIPAEKDQHPDITYLNYGLGCVPLLY